MMMGTALRAFAHPTDFLQRLGVYRPQGCHNHQRWFCHTMVTRTSGQIPHGTRIHTPEAAAIHRRCEHPASRIPEGDDPSSKAGNMIELHGTFYHGKTSKAWPGVIAVDKHGAIRLPERDYHPISTMQRITITAPLADIPRFIQFPSGAKFETRDLQKLAYLEKYFGLQPKHWTETLDGHAVKRAAAILALLAVAFFTVRALLPRVTERLVLSLPEQAVMRLSAETLNILDSTILAPSSLETGLQEELRQRFEPLRNRVTGHSILFTLLLRTGPRLGADSFALPGGEIVVGDDLIKLAENDEQILALLAHQIGHIVYRHTLRTLFAGSPIDAALLRIMSSLDAVHIDRLTVDLPTGIRTMEYPAEYEREAQQFAARLLRAHGISPARYDELVTRLTRAGMTAGRHNFVFHHPLPPGNEMATTR